MPPGRPISAGALESLKRDGYHNICKCPLREGGKFSLRKREAEGRCERCIQIPEGLAHGRDLGPALWTKRLGLALCVDVIRETILAQTKKEFPLV